jgi:hypothetical protein
MLDEEQVLEAVSLELLEKGYTVVRKSTEDPREVDMVARDPESGGRILISAAGVARSKAGRGKLAARYTESQVFRLVMRGFHSALRMRKTGEFNPGDRIGLAFPDVPALRKYLSAEKPVIDALAVKIFLVTEEKKVLTL